ncbi:MAG: c-type cytochrome [Methylobacterium mesophilicum]|nr:c-type cytochrome [Methylobacterium mesophilicum]
MRLGRIFLGLLVLILIAFGGFVAYAWKSEIPAQAAQPPIDPALRAKGEQMAAVGNCVTCHTAPGGKAFAGGLPLETPFGTIYSTNVTPDPETGIGTWSEAAFARSMREGVDREGNHLYPAFPYDHFTLVRDEDNRALYAYLMSLPPVAATTPANDLPFPLNQRLLVAGWKMLFFKPGAYQPDDSRDAEWNRGRYLAEGLGHCGSCHTPRNALGAEVADKSWDGAELEGWHAYAINEKSPAPVPWDKEKLAFYLANGFQQIHGVSRGTMAPVTTNLGVAAPDDVSALAAYVADRMGTPSPERVAKGEQALARAEGANAATPASNAPSADSQTVPSTASARGQAIYQSACASCHESGRALPHGGLNFNLSTAVNAPSPQNIINVTLYGLPAPEGEGGAIMPGFAGALDKGQLTDLIAYLRDEFSDQPAWSDLPQRVEDTMSGKTRVPLYRSDGTAAAPSDSSVRTTPWL